MPPYFFPNGFPNALVHASPTPYVCERIPAVCHYAVRWPHDPSSLRQCTWHFVELNWQRTGHMTWHDMHYIGGANIPRGIVSFQFSVFLCFCSAHDMYTVFRVVSEFLCFMFASFNSLRCEALNAKACAPQCFTQLRLIYIDPVSKHLHRITCNWITEEIVCWQHFYRTV